MNNYEETESDVEDKNAEYWSEYTPVSQFRSGTVWNLNGKFQIQGTCRTADHVDYLVLSEPGVIQPPAPVKSDLEYRVFVPNLGISIIDHKVKELLYVSTKNVNYLKDIKSSTNMETSSFSIGQLTVDCQSYSSKFERVIQRCKPSSHYSNQLTMTNSNTTSSASTNPNIIKSTISTTGAFINSTLQKVDDVLDNPDESRKIVKHQSIPNAPFLILTTQRDLNYSQQHWTDVKLEVQACDVFIDDVLLSSFIDYYQAVTSLHNNNINKEDKKLTTSLFDASQINISKDRLFNELSLFEKLLIEPIQFNLTIYPILSNNSKALQKKELKFVKFFEDQEIFMSLTREEVLEVISSIQGIPVTIPSLITSNVNAPPDDLTEAILNYYLIKWKRSWYMQVLANHPIMLPYIVEVLDKLSFGHESSLLNDSSHGSLHQIEEELKQSQMSAKQLINSKPIRNSSKHKGEKKKPRHIAEGLAYGIRDFSTSIFDGVTGIVTQPIRGAKKEGAIGAIKGVGKGLIGVVAKPVTGTINLVTQTAQGVKNTTEYLGLVAGEKNELLRKRLPRCIKNRQIKPFDVESSKGQQLLHTLDKGKYAKQIYVNHVWVSPTHCVLISNKILFMLHSSNHGLVIDWIASRIHPDVMLDENYLKIKVYNDEWKSSIYTINSSQSSSSPSIILSSIKHLIISIPNTTDLHHYIMLCPHLCDQYEKQGPLQISRKLNWRQVFCNLSNGTLSFSYKGVEQRISVNSAPIMVKAVSSQKPNSFTILSNQEYICFDAPSYEQKIEWVHVCLQNGAFLADSNLNTFDVKNHPKKFALKTMNGMYLSVDNKSKKLISIHPTNSMMNAIQSTNGVSLFPSDLVFTFHHVDPEKVKLETSNSLLSVDPEGNVFEITGDEEQQDSFSLSSSSVSTSSAQTFLVIKLPSKKIGLRSDNGKFLTVENSKVFTAPPSAVLPLVQPSQMFDRIYLPQLISLYIPKTNSFLTTNKSNILTTIVTNSITDSEKFIIQRVDGENYSLKTINNKIISSKGDNLTVIPTSKTNSIEQYLFHRHSNGLYSMATQQHFLVYVNNSGNAEISKNRRSFGYTLFVKINHFN
eukprot:TRINITY_DN10550_c0_g1_i1.p1 TRINITY_DN10550_c0_g1~~TRINITY_DN10550_c0_g1_i1.p1  ORF type:complete len:1160 (-),score=231.69 TRINITY_DN10550_c0_g1_i1:11-3280(-)